MKAGLLGVFMNGKKDTLTDNIIVCTAASLAGMFYSFEYYYESVFPLHSAVCICLSAVIAAVWLICGFKSGCCGRLGFPIFAFLYRTVPFLYILWYESRDNLHDYNKWLAMLGKILKNVLNAPLGEVSEKLGIAPVTSEAVLLAAVLLAYIIGFAVKKLYERRETDGGSGSQGNDS